jgi:hypothetical protein
MSLPKNITARQKNTGKKQHRFETGFRRLLFKLMLHNISFEKFNRNNRSISILFPLTGTKTAVYKIESLLF